MTDILKGNIKQFVTAVVEQMEVQGLRHQDLATKVFLGRILLICLTGRQIAR